MTQQSRKVTVIRTIRETDRVLSLILADHTGAPLPPWAPGAHIDLVLPSGRIRSYSLSGDPTDSDTYRLGVLREENGHGGSAEVHSTELIGRTVEIRGPRNNFKLTPGKRTIFIAGGIGITPILPMVRQLHQAGDPNWILLYCARTRVDMTYLGEIEQLTTGIITTVPQDTDGFPDLDKLLGCNPGDTEVYCCGPESLLEAVRQCHTKYLPSDTLHFERFQSSAASITRPSRNCIEVRLRRTGITLQVPQGQSILEAVRDALPEVSYSCESGICGACETTVLDGTPEHLDDGIFPRGPDCMLICVSRSLTPTLVLDL